MNDEIKSAGRVLDILDYLSSTRHAVPMSQIARHLGLPKSSTHGLLQTLAARGHVVQNNAGRYILIERGRHGYPFRKQEEPLVAAAFPVMQWLRDESGETVLLATMNARCDVRRLAKCVSHHSIRYDVNLDSAITPHCTAIGRVLLAHMPMDAQDAYFSRVSFLSYTPFTETDPAKLRKLLIDAHRDGYAINNQEFITGSTGIAAPVFDTRGEVVAAVNIGTLTSRYLERKEELLLLVRSAADKIKKVI